MDSAVMGNIIWTVAFLVDLAIKVAALILLPKHRKPTAAMSWLLAIFFIPYVGIALYLLIGNVKLPRTRMQEQARIDAIIQQRGAAEPAPDGAATWPAWFARTVEQNAGLTGLPPSTGSADLFDGYDESIAAMTREIDTATHFVHVEFYIVSRDATTGAFFTALENAVARGVTVRVLADYIASRKVPKADETFAELDRIGVEWSWMLPVMPFKGKYQRPDLRNHRKIVVVDGRVAFLGSQNLIDRTYNSEKNIARGLKWQELVTRVSGPVVAEANAVFLSDWLMETGHDLTETEHVPAHLVPVERPADAVVCQVVPSGPAYTSENGLRLFLSLIYGATERVIITSPYFVPDEAMVYAITTACQRGLDVQLFVSEIGDQGLVFHAQRSYYEVLLTAGVRIFLYPAPFILHAKHLSIDDDIAVIGSSNMDIRSFTLNMEVSLLVRGEAFVDGMRVVEQRYRTLGRELTLDEWHREPVKATFLDGLARLTSALN